jgi:uncharacterized membrane protein
VNRGQVRERAENSARFIERAIPWIVAVCSIVAFAAAVVLLVEKLKLIDNPAYVPTCSINPVLSCGSIMKSSQAEAFGFPNPLLGIVGFGLLSILGAGLLLGFRPSKPLWVAVQAAVTFAFGFVLWLIFQSLHRIEALCPYCMVVWAAVIVLSWYVTLHNLRFFQKPGRVRSVADRALAFHGVILTAAFVGLTALIGEAFWGYWRTLV